MHIKKLLRRFLLLLLFVLLASGLFVGYKGYQMYKNAYDKMNIRQMQQKIQDNPNYTSIDDLPETYLNAIISVEDHRFYDHKGIDPIAITRAIFNDLRAFSFIEGGSTITQQLAKNQYFTQEKSILRKVADAFMALEIERHLDKKEILELYVNSIYFGSGYTCVFDASMGYFNKIPKDMTHFESTLLAGIPNAPSAYAPNKNPKLAAKRQKKVLEKMTKYGYMTKKEAIALQKQKYSN